MDEQINQKFAAQILQFQLQNEISNEDMAKLLSDQLNDYINQPQQVTA